jgi:hypothetical protein
MFWFLLLLSVTIALAVALALIGRIAARAFRIDALAGDEPEHWLAALLFGTGFITLLCGWFSYAGLSAHEYRWIILNILLAMMVVVSIRGDSHRLIRFDPSAKWHLIVGGILVVRLAIYLLPVLFGGSHLLVSDATNYVPAADWLGRNGFGTSLQRDPEQPVQSLMILLQQMNHRMGPMFLHGLVAVSVPELGAFELFPVMIGLGTMLNLGAIYLICRWCFSLSLAVSATGLLFMAILAHTLASSSTGTFLCQIYGTAVLGTAIAFMPILTDPQRWTNDNALFIGFLCAFQLSMYSELTPVLVLTGAVWVAVCAVRSIQTGTVRQLAAFLSAVVLLTALLANIEIIRCWRGVQNMLKLDGVGCHMPWSLPEFAEFALGGTGFDWRFGMSLRGSKRVVCTTITALLFLAGIRQIFQQRSAFVASALVVLAGLFAYFSCCSNDPWTGASGHTWNLFKIAKWAYPFAAVVQIAGLACVIRMVARRPIITTLAIATMFCVVVINMQQHIRVSRAIARQTLEISGGQSPYSAVRELRNRLADAQGPIYFVRAPETDFKGPLIVGWLYPHPVVNSWRGDPLYGTLGFLDDTQRAFADGPLYLQYGEPPFETPLERLPCNFSRLDAARPALFRIDYVDRSFTRKIDRELIVGEQAVTLWIFAARAGMAELAFDFAAGTDTGADALTIAVNDAGPISAESTLLSLRPGINRVTLRAVKAPLRFVGLKVLWRDR